MAQALGIAAGVFFFFAALLHLSHRKRAFLVCAILGVILSVAAIVLSLITEEVERLGPERGGAPTTTPAPPATQIIVAGQEFSLPDQVLGSSWALKVDLIRYPEDSPSISTEMPFVARVWDYPENTKLYHVIVHNQGSGADEDVQVKLDFFPSFITEIENLYEEGVSVPRGGLNATWVEIEVEKLLGNTIRDVLQIAVDGKNVPDVSAQSGIAGVIANVYVADIVLEPMLGWRAHVDKENGFGVALPSHWLTIEPSGPPLLAGALSDEGGFLALVEIWKDELPESMNVEDAFESRADRLPWRGQEYQTLGGEKTGLNGLDGYEDIYLWLGEEPWQLMVFYLIDGRTEWFLQFSAGPSRWAEYEQVFRETAQGFLTEFPQYSIQRSTGD